MRAKCFRSMKKNEEPHRLHVVFKRQNEVAVESLNVYVQLCSRSEPVPPRCWAHIYTCSLKSVPPVVSKTSKPQANFSIKLFR